MIAVYRRLIGCAVTFAVLALARADLGAQGAAAAKDTVRLQFEITQSGTPVAKPVLLIQVGQSGSVKLDALSFSVVPTREDGKVRLQFEFKDGPKPSIVLKGDDGSGKIWLWQDKLEVKVTLVK